jgi:hypothetical protein
LNSSDQPQGAHEVLFKPIDKASLSSLDVTLGTLERNNFAVRLKSSTNRPPTLYTFNITGLFNTQDTVFMDLLDTMALDALHTRLEDKKALYHAIHNVSLICGYVHLLCSTSFVTELVRTTRDGIPSANEHGQYNLHTHLQFIIFSRMCELLTTSLEDIRFEDSKEEDQERDLNAFAAAAILRYSIAYFRRSLRHGYLSTFDHVSYRSMTSLSYCFK